MLAYWKQQAKRLKLEIHALTIAYRDPRTPWYAKLFAACVVGYAFSPIDLIPDPIPILGYVDDLILLPIGIWLALKIIPAPIMEESRNSARLQQTQKRPTNWVAAGIIILLWLGLAALAVAVGWRFIR